MKFSYKRNDDFFTFYKNDCLIKVSNNNPLIAINLKHAELILKDLRKKEVKLDQFSILGLSMFASSLDKKLINEIILKLLKNLDFDLLLYRYFDDQTLLKLMNKKYDPFINKFNESFNMKLKVIEGFIENANNYLDKRLFKKFIQKLNNFYLTALFKLSGISKTVILSYFFLENKVNTPEFFRLINLENKFQQNHWGYVDEQKKNDQYYLSSLKKISFFLKNVN
jgi:chaperone required for assembly of F1-ATPase